jgi:PAS domain S-box-containing protein
VLARDSSLETVTCTARDITERKHVESVLAESEDRLRRIFAQAPVAIVVFRGPEFVVELANPSYQALLPEKNLVGRRFADIVPELGQDVWAVLRRVVETGEPYIANEWHVPYDQNGDGVIEDVWFNVVYHPLRDPDGKVGGMVAVCSDVSVQVRARQQLERTNRDLEEFAYVASHDLQEPLRMVNVYSELLLNSVGPGSGADLERYAGYVRSGVSRMEDLIRDLLAYSQTVHADKETAGECADVAAALQQALKVLDPRIKETQARVTWDALPQVVANEGQLVHVFQNLLSNALKYRKPGIVPDVHIGVARQDANWVLSVADNGIGFDQGQAERIFGLFKRLHRNDEEYPGTGLGLAICKRIIERYHGRMWAQSAIGVGSTFYFALPRAPDV